MHCKDRGSGEVTGGVIALVCVVVLLVTVLMWYGNQEPEPVRFNLAPISDGVYAHYQEVVSSIPAQNYDMLTVCEESGGLLTVKGNIKIVFVDDTKPYGVYVSSNTVNNDNLTIYVPSGSVEIHGATRAG